MIRSKAMRHRLHMRVQRHEHLVRLHFVWFVSLLFMNLWVDTKCEAVRMMSYLAFFHSLVRTFDSL